MVFLAFSHIFLSSGIVPGLTSWIKTLLACLHYSLWLTEDANNFMLCKTTGFALLYDLAADSPKVIEAGMSILRVELLELRSYSSTERFMEWKGVYVFVQIENHGIQSRFLRDILLTCLLARCLHQKNKSLSICGNIGRNVRENERTIYRLQS